MGSKIKMAIKNESSFTFDVNADVNNCVHGENDTGPFKLNVEYKPGDELKSTVEASNSLQGGCLWSDSVMTFYLQEPGPVIIHDGPIEKKLPRKPFFDVTYVAATDGDGWKVTNHKLHHLGEGNNSFKVDLDGGKITVKDG